MRKLSQAFDNYVLPLFMGTVFFVLGAHALRHQSHPGAALYLIGFILWGYLRRISADAHTIMHDVADYVDLRYKQEDNFMKHFAPDYSERVSGVENSSCAVGSEKCVISGLGDVQCENKGGK